MKQNKNILTFIVIFAVCILLVGVYPSLHGGQNNYDVQPEINVNRYLTDNIHTKDAYERLMDRYMDLAERNMSQTNANLETTAVKIESIDAKLTELCERTARIEKALGIKSEPEIADNQLSVRENENNQQESEGSK